MTLRPAHRTRALQHLADQLGQRVLVANELSDEEAIELFNDDPVKNFDVLRNRHVDDDVDLSYNMKITSLPEGLEVGGWLGLVNCTSLESLPEGLKVGGWLGLSGCKNLTSLPEGLTVGGNLDLLSCTSLASLPEGLTVGGRLTLRDCTSLTSLPEDFSVGRDIYLNRCTQLKVWLVKERKIEWLRRKVKGQIKGLIELSTNHPLGWEEIE